MIIIKKYTLVIAIILAITNLVNAQEQYFIHQRKSEPQGEPLTRPENVVEHAYLFESDQDGYSVFFWVEYAGLVDSINKVHKLHVYESNGLSIETGYYFVVKQSEGFNVDLKDYKVNNAITSIITIQSDGKNCQLARFNYPSIDNDYVTDIPCLAENKDDFILLTAYEDNRKRPDICTIKSAMDVFVNIDLINDKEYNVTFQNEFGKFYKRQYSLKAIEDKKPNLPFKLKYYHINSKRIYLVDENFYLEMVN